VVLATSDYYFPGEKGGGAVQALANMVSRVGDTRTFKIITRDRDLGDESAYPSVAANRWHRVGKAEVMYLSPARRLREIFLLARNTGFDILYLNSSFSPTFTVWLLVLRKLGLVRAQPLIVAPRGEFSPGALRIKGFKKRLYLWLARLTGLYRHAIWHVSTEDEKCDVQRHFGRDARVIIARDCLPNREDINANVCTRDKVEGRLDIVFLSRICRKKNLDGAVAMLAALRGAIRMHIYGPQEDPSYWKECQALIERLPDYIEVKYCGAVAHEDVPDILARYHLFILPTHGENFGYAIIEALLAGCPVLISDQTPWRDLQAKGVGWDLPLGERERFREVLQACIDMDQAAFLALSARVREYGLKTLRDDASVEQSSMLFERALV
jgi:glycosyltransferase involved in cell wall biosynthesis